MQELAYQLSVAGESLGKELATEATFVQGHGNWAWDAFRTPPS